MVLPYVYVITIYFCITGLQHLKPSELEMVTQCKMLMADVASQRHHVGMAVHSAFSAMKLLKSSQVFIPIKKSRLDEKRFILFICLVLFTC